MPTETLTLDQLPAWAANRDRLLSETDFRPLFARIKVALVSYTKQNFTRGTAPDGTGWAPLKNPSRRRGGATAKPLRDKGILMASLAAGASEETATRLSWGTNVYYGVFHQYGTRKMPARPFVGFNDPMANDIGQIVAQYAAEKLAS